MKLLFFSLIATVDSHGQLSVPPSRNGGTLDTGSDIAASHWFVTNVQIPGNATLPIDLITLDSDRASKAPWNKNPWRAPGTTGVVSPCGISCGEDACDPASSPPVTWQDGRDLPATMRTVWQRGDIVEVAWSPSIQHGGGYAYRLCPVSEKLEEDCFQQLEHHLEFVDDFHTIHWTADGMEETIPAKRTKTGTFPPGSHWTMNPIPIDGRGPPPAFPNPCKLHNCGTWPGPPGFHPEELSYSIKDRVKVPSHFEPGNYTISWRWDCEESQQVWTNCGDITITGEGLI
jgi:hypothetical protein